MFGHMSIVKRLAPVEGVTGRRAKSTRVDFLDIDSFIRSVCAQRELFQCNIRLTQEQRRREKADPLLAHISCLFISIPQLWGRV